MQMQPTSTTRPAGTPAHERSFNRNIQGLRGVLVLLVFLFHIHNSHLPAPALVSDGLGAFALLTLQFSVDLFFCISGFVIAGTLRRARSPAQFLEDRAIRILPVLWTTMPLVIAMEYAAGFGYTHETHPNVLLFWLLGNLFCLPPVIPLPIFHLAAWSLSYEMAFYALCTAGWMLRRTIGAAWLVALPAALLISSHPRGVFFLVGLAVAEGHVRRWCPKWMIRAPLLWLPIFLAAWGVVFQLNGGDLESSVVEWYSDWRLPLAIVAIIAVVPFFQGLVDSQDGLARLLGSRPAQWMGKISYSFYLWQFLVLAATKQAIYHLGLDKLAGMLSQPLFLLLALPPTLIIAALSQEFIEKRVGIFLRHRLHHSEGWTLRLGQ